MWTVTTTMTNNKKRFITLITPLNKFASRTSSGLTVNRWMRNGSVVSSKQMKTQQTNKHPVKA